MSTIDIRTYLRLVKVRCLLFSILFAACSQHTPQPAENSLNYKGDNLFFADTPELTLLVVDEEQLFTSLFVQLSELPKIPYKSLSIQLQAIGQEADKIKAEDFPDALQIPQLIGRYKVFRTRIGIVRHTDASQHITPKFASAMSDVVLAWNTFARHYNRLATQPNL